ncbi:MAG: adenosine kinase [Pseudomonadota bacterium]
MTSNNLDVLCYGNAIVDMIAQAEDNFLQQHGLTKSAMHLIDEARAEALYEAMGPVTEISGGSAANTAAGIASLGGKAGFIGKVKADGLGKSFTHDIRAVGVTFTTPPAQDGPATARSMILVTPDSERTMNTYLGASQNLEGGDVDTELTKTAKVVYLEGYLWDPPKAKEAFRKAAKIAHEHGRKVALTLSDLFCIEAHRDEFLNLMKTGTIDIVFANEAELKALYQTADYDTATKALQNDIPLAIVTRSEKGCVILNNGEQIEVPAQTVETIIDTTGAGDLFAAGFLYGLTNNLPLQRCGELGAMAAAEVISHLGARPQTNLRQLAIEKGLLV